MTNQLESLKDRIIINGQTIWLHPPQNIAGYVEVEITYLWR